MPSCTPIPVDTLYRATFNDFILNKPLPTPYYLLSYTGFTIDNGSPSPHVRSPANETQKSVSLGPSAKYFNLTSLELACSAPPCNVTMTGIKIPSTTEQGAAAGMILYKTIRVEAAENGADSFTLVDHLDEAGWTKLERVNFIGKAADSEDERGVALDNLLYRKPRAYTINGRNYHVQTLQNPMTTSRPISSASTLQQPQNEKSEPHDEGENPQVSAKDEKEAYRVDWEDDDPENPRNWRTAYKGWLTLQLGMLALAASLGSSIISPAENAIAEYAHISPEVATLALSLYVLGFAFGPLLWAPISEVWGRKVSLLPAMFCLGLFSIGTATSKTPAAIFITRFFGGVFGSAPVSNVSAALGDIWAPKARGTVCDFSRISNPFLRVLVLVIHAFSSIRLGD
ncbi:MAG: hypothetical protein Q9179_005905 [Wetmoreana sp. 5 TL-2023]